MKNILNWLRGWRLREIAFASAIAIGVGYTVIYFWPAQQGPIYEFNAEKDMQPILDIFEKDRYWLTDNPDKDHPEFMLRHRSPYKDPHYFGKLHIKVLRENNQFAGFISYYMKTSFEGQLLFLGVKPEFRGRGYGKQLVCYALKALHKLGAKQVMLITRTTNLYAQKIYDALGFKEIYRDEEGYLYYRYIYN